MITTLPPWSWGLSDRLAPGPRAGARQPGWDTPILSRTQTRQLGPEAEEWHKLAGRGEEKFLTWDWEAQQKTSSLGLGTGEEGEESLKCVYEDGVAGAEVLAEETVWEKV